MEAVFVAYPSQAERFFFPLPAAHENLFLARCYSPSLFAFQEVLVGFLGNGFLLLLLPSPPFFFFSARRESLRFFLFPFFPRVMRYSFCFFPPPSVDAVRP